jgi:UDP-N-acetylmuramyl pentapeptide phosphotransferase/UDP-N-acetylglucosamine-1-phosphate transferase
MLALPLICSTLAAIALAPMICRALAAGPLARQNYRGRRLASPLGIVVVAAALVALVALAVVQQLADRTLLSDQLAWVAAFILGVAVLGLADDALSDDARGWRGHLAALRSGRPDTGILKAVGTPALALVLALSRGSDAWRSLLDVGVLVLATHAFNLVDLRPGRSIKVLVLLAAGLTIAGDGLAPLWLLGLFAGPALVVGCYDLRERGMLGDTGSTLLGALAGVWLVLTLSQTGLIVALAALAAITVFGEFRSISAVIDRAPILRHLDSLGRMSDAIDA